MPRSVSPAPRDSDLLPDGQSATTVVYTAYRERPVTQAPRDSDLLLDGQSATAVVQAGLGTKFSMYTVEYLVLRV